MLLAHPGAVGQPEQAGRVQAHRRPGQLRLVTLEACPARLGALGGVGRAALGHAPAHPLQEAGHGEARVEQGRAQLLEAGSLCLDVVELALQRRGQVDQLLVGSQVALLDHGGRRDLEIGLAEQLTVERALGGGQVVGRRRGQADHERLARLARRDLVDQGLDQPAPQLEQVVALVQDDRPRAGRGGHALDERPAVGVEQAEEALPVTDAGDHGAGPAPFGCLLTAGAGRRGAAERVVGGVHGSQGLVGQDRERVGQVPVGTGGDPGV